jgi:hypothetical protein
MTPTMTRKPPHLLLVLLAYAALTACSGDDAAEDSAAASQNPGGSGGGAGSASGGAAGKGSGGTEQPATGGASGAASGQGGAGQGGSGQASGGQAGSGPSGAGQAGTGQAGQGGQVGGSKGPAYDKGTADCPADDGVRRIKMVNNCQETRWFKLDGRTTPVWARPAGCPWEDTPCSQPDDIAECTNAAKQKSPGVDPGLVYCKQEPGGGASCACNPHFELAPGEEHTLELPADAAFPSGTGWIATGCNPLGASCQLGDAPARNSVFEFTYDQPGQGALYYDISAVNAWTTASAVGMKSCGGAPEPGDPFWCRGTGCRFDVTTQCPDGSEAFAPAPPGCQLCPTAIVGGKQVLAGSCGTCPDGHSGNQIPTGTVFNANQVGGPEWVWQGSPSFASAFGHDEGAHANRRFSCGPAGCQASKEAPTTCLGGCDLCTLQQGVPPQHPDCIKYCCPDETVTYDGAAYRYDSAGCTALGVQAGTDYTVALKTECPSVYTYGYEDHSSTFRCTTSASLLIQACPDPTDFPSK